ncbi:MAG: PIN domain-containing protein [Clostridiales bacterium]|jgi:predicted nucleic acid-binding protein|nr:PIN domain-containing protein [Clostridiales bacterium]
MILVDTSVLIGYLKGQGNAKTEIFDRVLAADIPFGISPYTYHEILQGARNEGEYSRLREYLSTQTIHYLPQELEVYGKAAQMYFELRRRGITPRGTIDVLIALTAIESGLLLLHNDRDFDLMAQRLPELKILERL